MCGPFRPLHLGSLQAELITQRQGFDTQMAALYEVIGGAERIVKSTVPASYSKHTNRFLSIWCFSLVSVDRQILMHSFLYFGACNRADTFGRLVLFTLECCDVLS